MSKLTLEEILTLSTLVHAQGINAQMENARHAANHNPTRMGGDFYSNELAILESSISWMRDATELWEKAKMAAGKEYAGLNLADFIAQARPK